MAYEFDKKTHSSEHIAFDITEFEWNSNYLKKNLFQKLKLQEEDEIKFMFFGEEYQLPHVKFTIHRKKDFQNQGKIEFKAGHYEIDLQIVQKGTQIQFFRKDDIKGSEDVFNLSGIKTLNFACKQQKAPGLWLLNRDLPSNAEFKFIICGEIFQYSEFEYYDKDTNIFKESLKTKLKENGLDDLNIEKVLEKIDKNYQQGFVEQYSMFQDERIKNLQAKQLTLKPAKTLKTFKIAEDGSVIFKEEASDFKFNSKPKNIHSTQGLKNNTLAVKIPGTVKATVRFEDNSAIMESIDSDNPFLKTYCCPNGIKSTSKEAQYSYDFLQDESKIVSTITNDAKNDVKENYKKMIAQVPLSEDLTYCVEQKLKQQQKNKANQKLDEIPDRLQTDPTFRKTMFDFFAAKAVTEKKDRERFLNAIVDLALLDTSSTLALKLLDRGFFTAFRGSSVVNNLLKPEHICKLIAHFSDNTEFNKKINKHFSGSKSFATFFPWLFGNDLPKLSEKNSLEACQNSGFLFLSQQQADVLKSKPFHGSYLKVQAMMPETQTAQTHTTEPKVDDDSDEQEVFLELASEMSAERNGQKPTSTNSSTGCIPKIENDKLGGSVLLRPHC